MVKWSFICGFMNNTIHVVCTCYVFSAPHAVTGDAYTDFQLLFEHCGLHVNLHSSGYRLRNVQLNIMEAEKSVGCYLPDLRTFIDYIEHKFPNNFFR